MKRKTYLEVVKIFEKEGCKLLSSEYKNNATKMSFQCKCGNKSEITMNQFKKSPQCYDCGIEQMRNSKDRGQQPCRFCGNNSEMMERKQHGNICRKCYNQIHKEHRRENRHKYFDLQKHLEYNESVPPEYKRYHVNKSYYKTRFMVLEHYSPELCCERCGFNEHLSALSIDHVNGDGAQHRREIGNTNIYQWIKKNDFPSGFQVLCMNCQFIKRWENKEYGGNQKVSNSK